MVLELTPQTKSNLPMRSTTMKNLATERGINVKAQPLKQLTMKKTKSTPKASIDIPIQWQGVRGDISDDPIA